MTFPKANTCVFFVVDPGTSFVRSEILHLSGQFSRLIVFCSRKGKTEGFPANVSFPELPSRNSGLRYLPGAVKLLLSEWRSPFSTAASRAAWRSHLSLALHVLDQASLFGEFIQKEGLKNAFFYSYWFNEQALTLALLRDRGVIGGFVTRAHGRDVFEEREPQTGRLPFREYALKWVNRVSTVSLHGMNYLKHRYPAFSQKIDCLYLGTAGASRALTEAPNETVIRVASIARVRNIKRLHLIGELLEYSGLKAEWWHFGDENLGASASDPSIKAFQEMKHRLENNELITLRCMGHTEVSEILKIYSHTYFHLFISVSETEGLPVSLMEAASAGIPMLATDAGGCREIVKPGFGRIIPIDYDAREVASWMKDEFLSGKLSDPERRAAIRRFWEEVFREDQNFQQFMEQALLAGPPLSSR